jgi:2-desacetyl-2-hydroxyethyl bacteriochlorophyllide A dehydrogenase
MKTISLARPGKLECVETAEPGDPAPDEAVVRVHRAGVCGTDIGAYRGKQPFFSYPRIIGHELGVTVEAVGTDVKNVAVGDRCAVEPYLNCGRCIACRYGKTNCCVSLQCLGVHTDGGMRERILIPARKLHKSGRLSLDQLALVETLGIGAHAVSRAAVEQNEHVLVIGAGPIGLAVMQFAKLAGAKVAAMDVNPSRLQFAREVMKVDETVAADGEAMPRLRDWTDGDLPTVVFDATGNVASMNRSLDSVAAGGRLVFVGLVQAEFSLSDAEFHRRETTLLASRNALASDFTKIIEHMEAGRIDTTPWITHRCRAEEMPGRFESWLDPTAHCVKAMVEF